MSVTRKARYERRAGRPRAGLASETDDGHEECQPEYRGATRLRIVHSDSAVARRPAAEFRLRRRAAAPPYGAKDDSTEPDERRSFLVVNAALSPDTCRLLLWTEAVA